jgi:hypothetical protein
MFQKTGAAPFAVWAKTSLRKWNSFREALLISWPKLLRKGRFQYRY